MAAPKRYEQRVGYICIPVDLVPDGVDRSAGKEITNDDWTSPFAQPGAKYEKGPWRGTDWWCWAAYDRVTVRVERKDLQAGDIVVEGTSKVLDRYWTLKELRGESWWGTVAEHTGISNILCVRDRGPVLVIRSGGAPAAKAAPTAWNGRCFKCGKGTYTGFISVEHEGGGCP